jgi:hypothetical protein
MATPSTTIADTGGPDPLDQAWYLLEEFMEIALEPGGGTRLDVIPAEDLNRLVEQAIDLNTNGVNHGSIHWLQAHRNAEREAAFAAIALRLLTEWAADERDRRRAQIAALNRNLSAGR